VTNRTYSTVWKAIISSSCGNIQHACTRQQQAGSKVGGHSPRSSCICSEMFVKSLLCSDYWRWRVCDLDLFKRNNELFNSCPTNTIDSHFNYTYVLPGCRMGFFHALDVFTMGYFDCLTLGYTLIVCHGCTANPLHYQLGKY
jgi:hypothetical protein